MAGPGLLSLAVALCALASPTAAVMYDPSSRFGGFSSDQYVRRSRADPEQVVPLVIGLLPGDFDGLEREFYSVSNPTHTAYGQYLAQDQANELSRPADGALDAVRTWVGGFAHENSTGTFSTTSNLYKVPMKVKHMERLLGTEIHHFGAKESESVPAWKRRRLMRAASAVAVPEHLQGVVSFLSVNTHPLGLRALGAAASQMAEMTSKGGGTLAQVRKTYGIPDNLVVTNASNTQCVPSFYDEAYDPEDLNTFFSQYLPGETPPQIIEKGGRVNHPERASTEASLDVQYITGVGRNATTFIWTMNGSNPYSSEDEPFVEFAQDVLALENPPLVVSISYSDDEEHIFDVSPGYARTLDTLLIKMGLRGITVLIAGGDDGVTGLRTEFEKVPVENMCKQSGPQWPSSSPYITTVGATMLLTKAQQAAKPFFRTNEEVICSVENGGIITSGGGFSNIYSIPAYQRTAVERYLATRNIPTTPGFFNASGRAYPDVAALGAGFLVYMNGRLSSVSGTSASTPVFGAMVTLWNDARLNAGKSPLGFINPLLYYLAETHPDAFHDVVVGNNGAPRGGNNPCEDSFSAAAGWDAVSGVGTPNFSVIYDFIADLEDHFNASQLGESNNSTMDDVSDNDATPTSGTSGISTFTMVLLVAAVVANVAIGIVVVLTLVKRWRNQYTPLDDVASGNATPTAPVSTTTSTSRIQRLDSAADSSEDDIELSEINLN
ncbi:polynucleotide 3'-phosphatase [Phytophthora pseudosyringae]|uniref:Polynucleotide 3'-phosphatase n=1 Tax=Phytophthora pseudosyringae TaxID=221518 RepID=A0A8T1VLW6_9STRA|nr:polynucleotide 3'-phosphatase [Phytophthora pseudosyringae]